MTRLLAALAFFCLALGFNSAGLAQVSVIGPITAGDYAIFSSTNVLKDGGSPGSVYTTLSGDCTATSLGVITCLKTNGTLFGTLAVQNANSVAITGGSITGLPTPANPSDAATKQYVDSSVSAGLVPHASVIVATTTTLPAYTYSNGSSGVGATLTATAAGVLTIDGVAPTINQRILVKNETATAGCVSSPAAGCTNGIYTLTTVGTISVAYVLTRATDANTAGTGSATTIGFGTYVLVTSGTVNVSTGWSVTSAVTTIGSNAINWTQFSAGTGVSSVSNNDGSLTISPNTGAVVASVAQFAQTGTGNVNRALATKVKDYAVTLEDFGGSGSIQNTTGTISSTTLALGAAKDFVNGQYVRINGAGTAFAVNQISGLTVAAAGTTGSTAYYVAVSTLDVAGGVGIAVVNHITNGNATLGGSNYVGISWTAPSGTAPAGYAVWVSIGGSASYNLIAIILNGVTTYNYGISVVLNSASLPDWIAPTTPPVAAQADWLISQISAGGGSTSLTLGTAATTSVTSAYTTHDDTTPCGNAVTAALANQGSIHLGRKTYPLTGVCGSITTAIEIYGTGFQGSDSNYSNSGGAASYLTSCVNASCLEQLNIFSNTLSAVTDDAVNLHNFEILYPTFGVLNSGAAAISITSATVYNAQSIVRDVFLAQADRCILIVNGQSFNFTGNTFYNCMTFSTLITSTVAQINASVGDWELIGNSFESGFQSIQAHTEIQTWGGGRVSANKYNTCGNGLNGQTCVGIDINPTRNLVGGTNTEPMVISGNSLEGCYYCIRFYGGSGTNTGSASLGVITGNQMWGTQPILATTGQSNVCGAGCWINGWTITGNVIQSSNGSGGVINLAGMAESMITGNVIVSQAGTATGIVLASSTSNINVQSNKYVGISVNVSNAGSANTVGGGSN